MLEVARSEFEDMTADLIGKTRDKVLEVMGEARLEADEIDRVLLVGGSTRMPAVHHMLAELFDQSIEHSVDPDLCVALGAAVQAGIVSGEPLRHILIDVAAHSLGTCTADEINPETGDADFFSPIIRRNTRIPVTRAEVYYTLQANQKEVQVDVFQGENRSCRENTLVDSFFFRLKPAPAGAPVVVTFAYDLQGIVHVTIDQKGQDNTVTVAVDLKRAGVGHAEVEDFDLDDKPANFIAQKARQLLCKPELASETAAALKRLVHRYESAMRTGEEETLIDDLEDRLVEMMDRIEEEWDGRG
jgi:molecular chaperone DnaK